MARPSEALKLADLTAENVGKDMVDLVGRHVSRLLFALAPRMVAHETDEPSNLQWTGELLTHYAQRGLDATDWSDHECAIDAIQEACSLLYSCAGKPGTFGVGDLLEEGDVEETPIGLVLVAAWSRQKLAMRGTTVTPRELAALSGMSAAHVRWLARRGELEIVEGEIARAEAVRWLDARGVPGFGRRGTKANDEGRERRIAMNEVTVRVALHELNDASKWFVEAAGRQSFGGVNRVVEDVVDVYVRSRGDEEVAISLRSSITLAERARLYGMAGLTRNHSTGEIGLGGEPVPTEEYLDRLDKMWGYKSETETIRWRVPEEIVRKYARKEISGPAAMSQAALELRTFMEAGKFEFPPASNVAA